MNAPTSQWEEDLTTPDTETTSFERRRTERIRSPLPVVLKVGRGRRRAETVVDNLSAGGFYVRLLGGVEVGEGVLGVVRFTNGSGDSGGNLRVVLRGRVLRAEALAGGGCGAAVRVGSYRFLRG